MKMVLTGDWHIGRGSWGVSRSRELSEAVERICLEEADAAILTGDIFDAWRYPGEEAILEADRLVNRLLDSFGQVLLVAGTHDWIDISLWASLKATDRFRIVTEPDVVDIGGQQILCLPYRKAHQAPDGLDMILDDMSDLLNKDTLLVAHHAVEGTVPNLKEPVLSLSALDELHKKGVTHAFFGHIHDHGSIAGSKMECHYTGTLYRTGFGEEGRDLGYYVFDTKTRTVTDRRVEGLPLVSIRAETFEEASSRLKDVPGDAYIRLIGDFTSDEVESLRQDSCLDIVSVKRPERKIIEANAVIEAPHELSVATLWEDYIEEALGDKEEKEDILRLGKSLLEGASPDDLWQEYREMPSLRNDGLSREEEELGR